MHRNFGRSVTNKGIIQYLKKKHLVWKVVQTDKRSVVTTAQLYKCGLYVETQSEPFVLTVASFNILKRMFFKNQPGASKSCA